jgi:hypothetical protein
MDFDDVDHIQQEYPFLSCIRNGETEYVCIIQNTDDKVMSFYDLSSVNPEERRLFLEFGEMWWWESNRQLPINIFLHGQMDIFRYCLRTINVKDVEVLFGPVTSLNELFKKRVKRRQIQLIKRETNK